MNGLVEPPLGTKHSHRYLTPSAVTSIMRARFLVAVNCAGCFHTVIQELHLANSPQARKRARQAETNRQHNAGLRARMRTYVKRVLSAIESGDKEAASTAYKNAVAILDKTVSKGLVHKNKAARHKSRLNSTIRNMGETQS